MVLKAYKFRLYPSEDQKIDISRHFGASRFTYNWALELRKANWEMIEAMRYSWGGNLKTCDMEMVATMRHWGLKDISKNDYPKPIGHKELSRRLTHQLKDELPWLREVADKPLRYALRNLDTAYKNFFRRCKAGGAPGYPKFKSRKSSIQSFQVQGENTRLDERSGLVSLPKIEKIPIRLHRKIDGTIKTTTVSRTSTEKYYISFQVEDGQELPDRIPIDENQVVGLDVGLNSFVAISGDEKIDGLKPFRDYEKRLAVLQRRVSRKRVGSANWRKAQLKVNALHEKIANQRTDFQHKLSRRLVDEHDAICVEDLNIKGMVKNHHLAKSISDAAWGEFFRQLEYKAAWAGKTFIKIDQWEPTSKTCSGCGHKLEKLDLSVREWTCPECGARHDRDINAAINIKNAGMNLLRTNAI
jgi:putative transposase